MEQVLLVLITGVVTTVGNWVVLQFSRRERVADRDAARLDRHHEELQKALAEFFDASAACYDRGIELVNADVRYSSSMDGGVRQDRTFQQFQEAEMRFAASQTDVRVKGFRLLLLLDKTDGLIGEVKTLMDPLPYDRKQLRPALMPRRERLQALTDKLEGVFIPEPAALPVSTFDPVELPPERAKRLLPPGDETKR